MASGKNTPEYQNVKKSFPKLTSAISRVIGSTSEQLLAAGLITDSQKAKAKNGMKDASDRASELVSLILAKVEEVSRNFYIFVGVLKEDLDSFRAVLNHMGVSTDDPSTASCHAPGVSAATCPMAFSDALSPPDLVTWLSQQLQAKGLTLDSSMGKKLIDDEINGEAFMDFNDKDLEETGFKKGQRKNILKIIQSIKDGKVENSSGDHNGAVSKPVQEEKKVEAPSDAPGNARPRGVSHKRNMPSGGRRSEPAPKRIKPDHCGGTMRNFSELKEVTSGFLDLIEWSDGTGKIKLSIYSQTAGKWKTIARKLGLEDTTPGFTSSTAKHHRDIDRECVIEVFGKWLENANGLPYASRFPKSWEGLHTLLVESELGEVGKKLYIALNAPNCSVRK